MLRIPNFEVKVTNPAKADQESDLTLFPQNRCGSN